MGAILDMFHKSFPGEAEVKRVIGDAVDPAGERGP